MSVFLFYTNLEVYTIIGTVSSFRPPFDKLLEPIKDDIAQINKNKSSNRIGNALTIAKGHIQEFLECGLSDVDNPSNMSTYSNDGYFLGIIV